MNPTPQTSVAISCTLRKQQNSKNNLQTTKPTRPTYFPTQSNKNFGYNSDKTTKTLNQQTTLMPNYADVTKQQNTASHGINISLILNLLTDLLTILSLIQDSKYPLEMIIKSFLSILSSQYV